MVEVTILLLVIIFFVSPEAERAEEALVNALELLLGGIIVLEEGLDLAGEIIENGAIAERIDFGVARLGHEPDAGFEAEIFTAVQAEGEELVIETTTIEAIEDFENSSTLGRDWG